MAQPQYHFDSNGGADIETWLSSTRPSVITYRMAPWIWVTSPTPELDHTSASDEYTMKSLWTAHLKANPSFSPAQHQQFIIELAKKYHILSGKWMLFPNKQQVDELWAKVARAVSQGLLGPVAKVAPSNPAYANQVICVYTPDITNAADVTRIRQVLRDIGFTEEIQYKAGTPLASSVCHILTFHYCRRYLHDIRYLC